MGKWGIGMGKMMRNHVLHRGVNKSNYPVPGDFGVGI